MDPKRPRIEGNEEVDKEADQGALDAGQDGGLSEPTTYAQGCPQTRLMEQSQRYTLTGLPALGTHLRHQASPGTGPLPPYSTPATGNED